MNASQAALGFGVLVAAGLSVLVFFPSPQPGALPETAAAETSPAPVPRELALQQYQSLSTETARTLFLKQSEQLSKPVDARLLELDELTTGCFGPKTIHSFNASDKNLGGQCCGALKDANAYREQLAALHDFIEANGNSPLIPRDPYDVPVALAQQLLSFDETIQLTAVQQAVFDEAVKMSHHGGPCCCKCWKWYVMSGLAKKLIVDSGWDEHQVAELWDLSSSCGHAEDTNYAKHYAGQAQDTGHTQH